MTADITNVAPFFIITDVARSVAFYQGALGFEVIYQAPADAPFMAIVQRGGAAIHMKVVQAAPLPNPARDPDARFDAFLLTPDPDALAAEYASKDVTFKAPLSDTHDGLRGFELTDPDGYNLFFGRPL